MPLPLLPLIGIGIAAIGTSIGAKKGYDSFQKNKESKNVNKDAQTIFETAELRVAQAREICNNALIELGQKKVDILNGSLTKFVYNFSKLKNVEFEKSAGLDELSGMNFQKEFLPNLQSNFAFAANISSGVGIGAAAGSLAAFGAFKGATAFGIASTGTAIGTLSGAVATKATLAFLGGGSLAAGGLGIAGGTAVLGGIVAGPALAIMGVIMDAKAKKNLENAKTNLAEAKKIAAELEVVEFLLEKITLRANLFTFYLTNCNKYFVPLVDDLNVLTVSVGCDYNKYTEEQKSLVIKAATLAVAIKSIIDTPILKEGDKLELTKESEDLANDIENMCFMREQEEVY